MANLTRRLKQLEKWAHETATDPEAGYRGLSPEEAIRKAQADLNQIVAHVQRRRAKGLTAAEINRPTSKGERARVDEARRALDELLEIIGRRERS